MEGTNEQLRLFGEPSPLEVWELSLAQFAQCQVGSGRKLIQAGRLTRWGEQVKAAHRTVVEAAMVGGKPVPPYVLRDHPDLAGLFGVESPDPLFDKMDD